MRDLAKIAKIQAINPIEGYDRVELATVENYPVIVQKGLYEPGDLVVYVGYDTLLPIRDEFEFLRKSSYSKMYDMFRIRNMSMCGVYSSGIVFSLDILPANVRQAEGVDVSEVLGIQKYDPEIAADVKVSYLPPKRFKWINKKMGRYAWYRKLFFVKVGGGNYPETVSKSDETNIEKIFGHLKEKHPISRYYVTEKMEGMAGAWLLRGRKREYRVYSHNTSRSTGNHDAWGRAGIAYNLEKILRSEKENYAIQGELVGPGIQGNIYKLPTVVLFVYKVTNVTTGKALNAVELEQFCSKHKLSMVPVIEWDVPLKKTLDEMLTHCEGKSVVGDNPEREGLVWRNMLDQNIGCKCKSRSYQAKFKGNKVTE